ncbi:MAG: hypothetical protein PWP64_82 [Candidatus Cloacimonadota bacterium]|nr:hypothetical protein [Candidatus Cloacimonadota bacterium]
MPKTPSFSMLLRSNLCLLRVILLIAKGRIHVPPIRNRQAVMAKGEIPSPKSFPASSREDHNAIVIRQNR